MKCPKCGAEVAPDARFCHVCGYPLKADAVRAHAVEVHEAAAPQEETLSIDEAVKRAAEARRQEKTQPMAGAEGVPSAGATARVMPEAMADAARVEHRRAPADFEAYIEAPATEEVFQAEEETDPSLGLERIDSEGAEEDATATLVEPRVAEHVPCADADARAVPETPAAAEEVPEKERRRHRRICVLLAVVAAAVLAAALGWYGYQHEWWGGHAVPDVLGQDEASARQTLEDAGFVADVSYTFVDAGAGTVLSMGTDAGTRQPRGTAIALVVGQARTMPDVVGMSKDDAAAALEAAGVASLHYAYESSEKAEGTVLATDPAAGATFSSTDTITVTLAQGYTVPDLIGMTEDAAKAALEKAGLSANVVYVEAERTAGTVDSTDPVAGTAVARGTTVTVNVAKAEEKASSLSDVRHIADYFSATPQEVAAFLAQQGYALASGAATQENYAECLYTKEYSAAIAFTPAPNRKVQKADSTTDVLAQGATIAGVQLVEDASDMGASAADASGAASVMAACGLSSAEASVTSSSSAGASGTGAAGSASGSASSSSASTSSSSSQGSSSGTASSASETWISSAGTSGDLVWCVLLYKGSGSGSGTVAVVTAAPKDFYTAAGLTSMESIAASAAATYLG